MRDIHEIQVESNIGGWQNADACAIGTMGYGMSGPLPRSKHGKQMQLVLIDQYHPTLELTICLPGVDTLSPSLSPNKCRCFRKCDFSKLNNLISQYNWTNLYNCFDIESATELFYSVLNSFSSECVPDSFPPKLDRPPWFTNQLQRLRNLKTNFYKKYKKSGRPSDFSRYVVARTNFNVLNSHCYSMYLNRCKFEFSKAIL